MPRTGGAGPERQTEDFFDGDLHAGISNITLEPDVFDLGEGISLRKTYAHLMAHFVMAFAPASPGSFHPGPWKPTKSLASAMADITVDLHIPATFPQRLSIATTIVFMLRFGISPGALLSAISNHPFASLKDVADTDAIIIPFEIEKRHFPLS